MDRNLQVTDRIWRNLEVKLTEKFVSVATFQHYESVRALYEEARDMPGFTTTGALFRSGISLGEPADLSFSSSASYFFPATEVDTGKPLVLKQPRFRFRELEVCQEFKLAEVDMDFPLVQSEYRTIQIREGTLEKGKREQLHVLVMPRFAGSLATPIRKLSSKCIFTNCQRIITAINWIHQRGYVHMDVKEANIFISTNGNWHLGDFGSCVRLDRPIVSYTRWYYKAWLRLDDTHAQFEHDWYMFAVSLLAQALIENNEHNEPKRTNINDRLTNADWGIVDHDKCMQAIATIAYLPLRNLLEGLMAHTESQFPLPSHSEE